MIWWEAAGGSQWISLSWSIKGLLPLYTVLLYEVHWHNSHLSWVLSSAVNVIHSSLQSLFSLFSLYFHHCCSLSLLFHFHFSLFWCRRKLFPLHLIARGLWCGSNQPSICFYPTEKPVFSTASQVTHCLHRPPFQGYEVKSSKSAFDLDTPNLWKSLPQTSIEVQLDLIKSERAKGFSTDFYKLQ